MLEIKICVKNFIEKVEIKCKRIKRVTKENVGKIWNNFGGNKKFGAGLREIWGIFVSNIHANFKDIWKKFEAWKMRRQYDRIMNIKNKAVSTGNGREREDFN